MKSELTEIEFVNIKNQILGGTDLSRKGNIDEQIVDIVALINSQHDFVTTSSCSGRIIVISKESAVSLKKGCKWVFVSHETVLEEDFVESLTSSGDLTVKFEPFILHVLCRTLAGAKLLQTSALQSGYRNSGITLGKHGKITVAVRSTLNIEVPISKNGILLVTEEYLKYLITVANEKMLTNKEHIIKFHSVLKNMWKIKDNESGRTKCDSFETN